MTDRNEGMKQWGFRRKLATRTLLVTGAMGAYAMWRGPDMVTAAFPSLAAIVTLVLGFYFTAAVYQDTRPERTD